MKKVLFALALMMGLTATPAFAHHNSINHIDFGWSFDNRGVRITHIGISRTDIHHRHWDRRFDRRFDRRWDRRFDRRWNRDREVIIIREHHRSRFGHRRWCD